MAYDKQKVIDIALNEVGYLEKETNANLDSKTGNAGDENYTKYARDLAKVNFFNGSKQGAYWCAVYVAWCYYKAYGKSAALKLLCQPSKGNCGAGCKFAREYFERKGQLHSTPKAGDVVFFYSSDKTTISHTGLVYKVSGSKVYTVEGNTSGASGVVANGGGVKKKSYSLSYSRIAGYGRPKYGEKATEKPSASHDGGKIYESSESNGTALNANKEGKTVSIELLVLSNGSEGEEVKTLQRLLNAMGFDCGKVDGLFGANTRLAVRAFQQMEGLDVDGAVGIDTWTALLK